MFSEDLDFVLERTEPLWAALRGERIFLTGGTGFFGQWLTETFDWANQRLRLRARRVTLTRRREAAERCPEEYWLGDLRTFPFPPGRFRMAIHAAIDCGDLEGAVAGTRRMAEFAARNGFERWLFTSSGAARWPETPLGAAKSECERVVGESAPAAAIARCYSFVGPYLPLDGKFAAGNFLRDKLAGGPVRVAGDGRAVRSYLYAAEMAVHLWTGLFRGWPGRVFEVGAAEAVTVGELAGMFECGVEVAGGAVGSTVYLPEGGIAAEIPLEVGLARTERWWRVRRGA
ncbi:MAG: NAD(P)-dependent oxidoreductase [Bryobacteraceae bacterium]